MDGPLLADISGTNTRRNALHEIGSAVPGQPRRSALEGGLTGHNQRGTSRSLTRERSPADHESTAE
jgi:hypothetical protein